MGESQGEGGGNVGRPGAQSGVHSDTLANSTAAGSPEQSSSAALYSPRGGGGHAQMTPRASLQARIRAIEARLAEANDNANEERHGENVLEMQQQQSPARTGGGDVLPANDLAGHEERYIRDIYIWIQGI